MEWCLQGERDQDSEPQLPGTEHRFPFPFSKGNISEDGIRLFFPSVSECRTLRGFQVPGVLVTSLLPDMLQCSLQEVPTATIEQRNGQASGVCSCRQCCCSWVLGWLSCSADLGHLRLPWALALLHGVHPPASRPGLLSVAVPGLRGVAGDLQEPVRCGLRPDTPRETKPARFPG